MTTTAPAPLTGTYRLDPHQGRLRFVARQAVLGKVHGRFETFAGAAHLDFAAPGGSSVELTIEVDSLTTGNARRDRHLRAAFFDAVGHPRITFRSRGVDVLEDDRYRLAGELTIRARTRPVVVDVVRTAVVVDPDGACRVQLRGRGTLNRKDWGVVWNVALEGGGMLVSNTIAFELDVAAVRHDGQFPLAS